MILLWYAAAAINRSAPGHDCCLELAPIVEDRLLSFVMTALAPYYLILKSLHVIFMVTWFAGLFYLPRLFIYHSEAGDEPSRDRFEIMERRLFGIMTIGAALTALFGIVLLGINHALIVHGWFQLKLALLAGLAVYHYRCYLWLSLIHI